MKHFERAKGFILGVMLTLIVSTTIAPALAATIEAAFNSINIKINGQQVATVGQSYKLDNGTEVPFSIVYKGTTYLPLRKIGEMYGKDVLWDGDTSTASVNDKGYAETKTPSIVSVKNTFNTTKDGLYLYQGTDDVLYVSVLDVASKFIDYSRKYTATSLYTVLLAPDDETFQSWKIQEEYMGFERERGITVFYEGKSDMLDYDGYIYPYMKADLYTGTIIKFMK